MCIQPRPSTKAKISSGHDRNAFKVIGNNELRQHNSPSDAWCAINGRVVDITTFAKHHPGGDTILLAAGRDATVLFKTYHPRGVPDALVKSLQVGVLQKGETSDSFYDWDSIFYETLCERVVMRLKDRKLPRRGGYEIWIKAIMLVTAFWYSLIRMYIAPTFPQAALWSAMMGIAAA